MTEQPRDWDKEMANIDRAIAKQSGAAAQPPGPVAVSTPVPSRRLVALAWFWALVAAVLAVALLLWPYDKSCGIRLIFFLGAAVLAVVLGIVGAVTSWAHRQGAAMLLSLLVILWAGVMAAREILPRAGYARQTLDWTCPSAPPAAASQPPAPAQ
jgi:hypothetical protein